MGVILEQEDFGFNYNPNDEKNIQYEGDWIDVVPTDEFMQMPRPSRLKDQMSYFPQRDEGRGIPTMWEKKMTVED